MWGSDEPVAIEINEIILALQLTWSCAHTRYPTDISIEREQLRVHNSIFFHVKNWMLSSGANRCNKCDISALNSRD